MRTTWAVYLVVGLVGSVGLLLLPAGPLRDTLIVVAGVSAVVAVLTAVRRYRPERRLAWVLMAVGAGLWMVGDALWVWFDHVLGIEPFPSGADVAYLAAYPVLGVALHLLSRRRTPGGDRAATTDALIVALAAALLLWAVFIEPTWTAAEGSPLERLVGVAYPIGDVILITQLVQLGSARSIRSPAVALLGAATLVMLCADLLFQSSPYLPWLAGTIGSLDPLWAGFYVLWGAAALHPSMVAVSSAEPPAEVPLTPGRLGFLAVTVLVLPGIVLGETALGVEVHTTEVSMASVVLIGLVLLRLLGLVRRMRHQADRLKVLADTDPVTGLHNARCFGERLEQTLARRSAGEPGPTLLLVSVERFAEVNDTLGLRTGEALLHAVGRRIVEQTETDGVAARLGGESFAVLLPTVGTAGTADARAADLVRAFETPFELTDLTVTIDVAVGIALAPTDADDAAGLLQRADAAVSAAKEVTSRVARYSPDQASGGPLTPLLMAELEAAMASGQVILHFQPQVDIATGHVLGLEALVRWDHPVHGLLGPVAFVPAAERTGMIRALTAHVLDVALAEVAGWRADGRELGVSVNLSVRNLLDPKLVGDVRAALERHHVPAGALELEITETMAMVDPTRSVEVLGALRELGVTLSVDDYGTGHSSLAYLQRLPVGRLKIDRSFVAGVVDNPSSAAIVRSTVELARHLGLDVIAEGVEDDDVLLALRDMRCFGAQGFGLARPVPADRVLATIDAIEVRVPGVLRPLPTPRSASV